MKQSQTEHVWVGYKRTSGIQAQWLNWYEYCVSWMITIQYGFLFVFRSCDERDERPRFEVLRSKAMPWVYS